MSRRRLLMSARLPSAYQEVEWIGANRGPYISTPFTLTSDSLTFDLWYSYSSFYQDNAVLSFCKTSQTQGTIGCRGVDFYTNPSKSLRVIIQMIGSQELGANAQADVVYDLSCTVNRLTGLTATQNGTTVYISGAQTTDGNLRLFINSSGAVKADSKVYKLIGYRNGACIFNFVPCYRKSDNEIGMYDLINDVFYTNQGTGTFTKGADVL